MAKNNPEPALEQVQEQAQPTYRPVAQIVTELLRELENHPDVHLGNCEIGGPCPQQLQFKDTPRSQQHLTQLRIAYRDPAITVEAQAGKPWKWQGVIDAMNAPPAPVQEEKPNPKWEHLLPPTKAELVEAGA